MKAKALETTKIFTLPDDENALIRRADIPNYLPVSSQTLARWATEGNGPPFVKVGKRIVAYRVADLRAWLTQQHPGGRKQ